MKGFLEFLLEMGFVVVVFYLLISVVCWGVIQTAPQEKIDFVCAAFVEAPLPFKLAMPELIMECGL